MERATQIETRLREAFAAHHVEVRDDSRLHAGHEGAKSGGGHFAVTIVSPAFRGKSAVQRHQMIYQALGGMMQREIHALGIRALTPEESGSTTQT